ncbi:hypothetical protein T03_8547 [Trichinella britovi]|uniref:Uncharacterized protein n=1 Tax=Trichinella britovi TaxID=45882 RepID=A0A0V1CF32_TRIBR|nr:hypothetical protein T03_8547 [Trichinella britovi]
MEMLLFSGSKITIFVIEDGTVTADCVCYSLLFPHNGREILFWLGQAKRAKCTMGARLDYDCLNLVKIQFSIVERRCFSGEFRQSFTSTSVECCLPSAAFIQACLVLLGMSRSDGHLGWVPFFSVPTTRCGSSRWRTYYIKAEVELRPTSLATIRTLVMRTVAPCGWRSRSIDKLDIDRQSCESDLQCRK